MPFVNIGLISEADSTQIKGTISDESGRYELRPVKPGKYFLKFFAVGYETVVVSGIVIDSLTELTENITLHSAAVSLNEVAVTSIRKTVEFKNGMTVMNVENSIMAAGNTVLDVLKRIPGVTVDSKNNVTISGKQGVRFLIDGRLQQLSMEQVIAMLSAMTADQLQRIEVMKNPPVKYDAGGNAGLINIVTKKVNTQGYSGNITYNPGMGQRFGNSMYATLNFKSKKLTLFSNVNPMYKTFYDRYDYHKYVTLSDQTTVFDHTGDHENERKYISGKIGADYAFTPKTVVGIAIANTVNDINPIEHGYVSINGYNDVGFDYYRYITNEKTFWTSPSYNLNAEHKLDTLGSNVAISLDYAGFTVDTKRNSQSVFYLNGGSYAKPVQDYSSLNDAGINIFTQKIDYQQYIKSKWLIETGAKTTFVDNHSDFRFKWRDTISGDYRIDTSFTNIYNYKEQLIAGYANARYNMKRGSIALGVRAEHTKVTGHNLTSGFLLTRNYINFFPNLSFDYQLSEKVGIQVNYNRRLDRPDYIQLNPFRHFEDQYAVGAGNPYLNPQYSDNFDVVCSYNQWMTHSIGYAHFTQLFSDISFQNDTTKVTVFTQINLNKGNYYYYNLFLQYQFKPWWNAELSLNVYYMNYNSLVNQQQLNKGALSCNVYVNNDFVLPKNFKIQLTAHYNAPAVYGANYNFANGSCDFGIKKSFYDNKLNIMFQFLDMFYNDYSRTEYKFGNQFYTFESKDDTRRFRLTFSYKFGKTNIRGREKYSNEQETGRIKKG